MPMLLQNILAVLGALAALVTLTWFSVWLKERLVARVIVQTWWELTLSPIQRKRFRKSLNIGLKEREVQDRRRRRWDRHMREIQSLGRWEFSEDVWRELLEPAWPLSIRHVGVDGVWALRVLIYNPSSQIVRMEEVEEIVLTIPTSSDIKVLSWQFDDGRIAYVRKDDREAESVTYSIRIPTVLRPQQKIREELAVAFNSHGKAITEPPEVEVAVRAYVKTKIKKYRPATSISEAINRTVGESLETALERVAPFPPFLR